MKTDAHLISTTASSKGMIVKPLKTVIHLLPNIVSKNGIFCLNIP